MAAAMAIHAFLFAVLHAGGIATGCAIVVATFRRTSFSVSAIHAFFFAGLHASLVAGSLMLRACFAVSAIDAFFFATFFTSIIAGLGFAVTTGTVRFANAHTSGLTDVALAVLGHDTIRTVEFAFRHPLRTGRGIDHAVAQGIHCTLRLHAVAGFHLTVTFGFRLAAIVAYTGAMTAAVYGNQRRDG